MYISVVVTERQFLCVQYGWQRIQILEVICNAQGQFAMLGFVKKSYHDLFFRIFDFILHEISEQ